MLVPCTKRWFDLNCAFLKVSDFIKYTDTNVQQNKPKFGRILLLFFQVVLYRVRRHDAVTESNQYLQFERRLEFVELAGLELFYDVVRLK